MKESWIYGCGGCGRDLYLLADLSVQSRPSPPRDHDWPPNADQPCENCQQAIDTGYTEAVNKDNIILSCLNHLMDWCQCGSPEDVTGLAMLYLETLGTSEKLPGEVLLLLAYLCDGLEWTEHGGSVYGAWLTDTGRTALARYKEVSETEEEQT